MATVKLTLDLDPTVAEALRVAAHGAGLTLEAVAAEAVAQHVETALRHRVLLERLETVDAQISDIAHFIEEATAAGGAEAIDLERLCRYPRKAR